MSLITDLWAYTKRVLGSKQSYLGAPPVLAAAPAPMPVVHQAQTFAVVWQPAQLSRWIHGVVEALGQVEMNKVLLRESGFDMLLQSVLATSSRAWTSGLRAFDS